MRLCHLIHLALALVLVGGALLPSAARAQAVAQPGFIVQLAGDTVRGRLSQRAARLNSLACRFEAASGEVTTYQPSELLGYGVAGQVYRSLLVPTPAGSLTPQFAEVLRDGAAQLYFGRDATGDHYYLRTPHLPLTELRHEYRQVTTGERVFQEEQNGFRQVLAQGLANCPAAQALLPRIPFAERSFARAVEAFNQCAQPPAGRPAAVARPQPRLGLEVVGGAQGGQLLFNDPQSDTEQHTTTVAGPVYGLGAWVQPARLAGRLSVHLQALYQPQQFSYAYTPAYHGGLSGAPVSATGHLHYLRGSLLARYKVPLGPLRALVEGGVSVAPVLDGAGTYRYTTASGTSSSESLGNNQARSLAKTDFALLAGAGFGVPVLGGRALALLARLEYSVAGSTSATLVPTGLRLYGLLSFDLLR